MSSEHVEVLRELRSWMASVYWDSRVDALDAAIASLSAPQPPAEAQAQGGGDSEQMTGDLLPCPFCGKSNQDRYPCEWLDGSGANVIRCAWCHGAAPMNVWNRRTAPPSAPVGVASAADAVMAVPELQDMACIGSMSPAEHALGLLQQAVAQQPAAVDGLNDWRAAFVAERATRYREGGMAIEQARIHAETDAALMEKTARQQPATCVGCEGKPAPENSPCNVCGQQPAAVDEAMVELLTEAGKHIETLHSIVGGEARNIVWKLIVRIRAALRDHDQEGKDG